EWPRALPVADVGRKHLPLRAIAEEVYAVITGGGRDLTKRLHLNRRLAALEPLAGGRRQEVERRREAALRALFARINARELEPSALNGAIICSSLDDPLLHDAP